MWYWEGKPGLTIVNGEGHKAQNKVGKWKERTEELRLVPKALLVPHCTLGPGGIYT